MDIPEDILVGIVGFAMLAVSLGVYEQRQIDSKKSDFEEPRISDFEEPRISVGGKKKTKRKKIK
jgi:hypothetical protein